MKIDQIHAALLQQGFTIATTKAITSSLFHDIETDDAGNADPMYIRARVERLESALNTVKKETYGIKSMSNDVLRDNLERQNLYDGIIE